MKTAFLIDLDFFLRRLRGLHGEQESEEAVNTLIWMCSEHMRVFQRPENRIYRILVYDCPPLATKAQYPVSKKQVDWSRTPTFTWRKQIQDTLKTRRKVALRLGRLAEGYAGWVLRPNKLKDLLNKKIQVSDLTDEDFKYDVEQKGVDMRIGLDIASIASKRLVDQMVLVAGDSDFVPAAKTARREGIDFVLDPMGASIPPDLHEHIDGVQTVVAPRRPEPW